MNIRELYYLAELVKRDGDRELQAFHGIFNRAELYNKLKSIADTANKSDLGTTHFAVFRDCDIGYDSGKEKP